MALPLVNGTTYTFRVSAINAVGTGSASGTAAVVPVTTPGAPTGLAGVAGNAQVSLSWSAPG
ncbi:MAG: fibronectin type III domain-containing protein, partial [Gemmatimonadales bacterium]|nr:fibronectin type III domain-containing protein [Gemmatimonadales bacterium]